MTGKSLNSGFEVSKLLMQLREAILIGRKNALRAVDTVQGETYWQIGKYIVEFELRGEVRAEYGKQVLSKLAEGLTSEFGRGFDHSNLRHMRLFYKDFPICDAVRHKLTWAYFGLI